MSASANDNGTLRSLIGAYGNDNGVLRAFIGVACNDNGTLRIAYFERVILDNTNVTYSGGTPAEFYLNADGNKYKRSSASLTNLGEWLNVPANVGNYESRATIVSGSLTSGTTGTWQNLGTTRSWTRGAGAGTMQTVVFTLEIRRVSDSVVLASATITLTSDRT